MKKQIMRLLALLFCLVLLAALTVPCFADAGGFAGDGDYGGGGGGDYGGGGDWGWNDDDYGDRSSGGGSGELSPVVIVFIVVFVLIVVVGNISRAKKNKSGGGTPSYTQVTAKATPTLQHIGGYRNLDPTFNEAQMIQKVSNLYVQMQQCWTRKDLSPMRPYLSDAFYAQLEMQLRALTSRGQTNYVDRIAVLRVGLDGFCQSDGNDHIYVSLGTRIVDYTLEDATGRLVSGSQTAEKFMSYRWHLVRPSGQTGASFGATRSISCPHCAAPLNINETARCPYCGSIVTVDKHDFVLTEIEGISQTTNR